MDAAPGIEKQSCFRCGKSGHWPTECWCKDLNADNARKRGILKEFVKVKEKKHLKAQEKEKWRRSGNLRKKIFT